MQFTGLIFSIIVLYTEAYPNGAPPERCVDMTPHHKDEKPQSPNSIPYEINVKQNGNKYTVTIKPAKPPSAIQTFKGFLITPRLPNGNLHGKGKWSMFDMSTEQQAWTKFINCQDPSQAKALTHSNSDPKSNGTFIYTSDDNEPLKFSVTVVFQFNTFWVNINAADDSVTTQVPTIVTTTGKSTGISIHSIAYTIISCLLALVKFL